MTVKAWMSASSASTFSNAISASVLDNGDVSIIYDSNSLDLTVTPNQRICTQLLTKPVKVEVTF